MFLYVYCTSRVNNGRQNEKKKVAFVIIIIHSTLFFPVILINKSLGNSCRMLTIFIGFNYRAVKKNGYNVKSTISYDMDY